MSQIASFHLSSSSSFSLSLSLSLPPFSLPLPPALPLSLFLSLLLSLFLCWQFEEDTDKGGHRHRSNTLISRGRSKKMQDLHDCEGYLYKKGGIVKNWKLRYFVLDLEKRCVSTISLIGHTGLLCLYRLVFFLLKSRDFGCVSFFHSWHTLTKRSTSQSYVARFLSMTL